MSKASTYAEWKARSARENLDVLGWARARTFMPAESTESAEGRPDPEDDPVASMLGSRLWISDGRAETATRMLRLKPKGKSEEELRSMGWPVPPNRCTSALRSWRLFFRARTPTVRITLRDQIGLYTPSIGRRTLGVHSCPRRRTDRGRGRGEGVGGG